MKNIEKFLPIPITILVLISLSLFVTGGIATILKILLIFIGASLVIFLFCWYVLAPRNIFFTFVEEGKAKIVVKGDSFERILVQWEGYTVDNQGNIVSEDEENKEPWHPFGGLRFFGFPPIYKIYKYNLRWTGIRQDGTPSSHEEELDSVLLKDFVYYTLIEKAEDKDMVPLNVDLIITARVVNPYKSIFVAHDWLEMVMNRIKPLFREYIANNPWEELKSKKQRVGGEVWHDLTEEGLIEEFDSDYGVRIKEGAIEMQEISADPEYQKAATAKYLAEKEAEKRGIEISVPIIKAMAHSRGRSIEEIQKEINSDNEAKKKHEQFSMRLTEERQAIAGGAFAKIHLEKDESTKNRTKENPFGSLIEEIKNAAIEVLAVSQKMPGGQKESGEKKTAKKTEDLSDEEAIRLVLEE